MVSIRSAGILQFKKVKQKFQMPLNYLFVLLFSRSFLSSSFHFCSRNFLLNFPLKCDAAWFCSYGPTDPPPRMQTERRHIWQPFNIVLHLIFITFILHGTIDAEFQWRRITNSSTNSPYFAHIYCECTENSMQCKWIERCCFATVVNGSLKHLWEMVKLNCFQTNQEIMHITPSLSRFLFHPSKVSTVCHHFRKQK